MLLRRTTRWLSRRELTPGRMIAAAVGPVAIGCVARLALTPVLGGGYAFITLFPALIVAGALGGWVGGFGALVLSTLAAWYLFIPPMWSFGAATAADAVSLVVFAVSGSLAAAVAALLRTAAERLARQEAEAHETARKLQEAFETQTLLMSEVNHRARNLIAVVQAVVRLTPRDDMDRFVSSLTGRIQALAHAHSLLSDQKWSGAWLADIVRAELQPFAAEAEQVDIEGPAIRLTAEAVQPLVLVFHELATNAAKYGGLSVPEGRVSIRWRRADDDRIVIAWTEAGGPTPRKPSRTGFGTKLIRTTLTSGHGGEFEQTWAPGGLQCVIRLPAAMAEASPSSADRSATGGAPGPSGRGLPATA